FFFLIADADRDRAVSLNDSTALEANFGGTNKKFHQGDFNLDTVVNLDDWTILQANFGRQLPAPITEPGMLTVGALSSEATWLTWSAPATGTWDGYRIFRSLDGIDFTQIAEVGPNTLNYSDAGEDLPEGHLQDGTKYWYRVRPFTNANGNGETTNKSSAVTVLPAVTSPTATATPEGYIDVTWVDESETESQFLIERQILPSGTFVEVGRAGAQGEMWRDWDAVEAQGYGYRVTAITPDAVSSPSGVASATAVSLAAPSDLSTSITPSSIALSWTDNSAVEVGYNLQRATDSAFQNNLITLATLNANEISYTDSGPSENSLFYYRIAPISASGIGGYSSFGAQTTLVAAPMDLTLSEQSNGDVVLNWADRSSVETGYRIDRALNAEFTSGLTVVATTSSNTITYTDSPVPGVYYYRVVALTSGGIEADSENAFLVSDGLAYRPANPTFNVLGETLWTGQYNDGTANFPLYAVRPGQAIFFSVRQATFVASETIAGSTFSAFWKDANASVLNKEYERVNSRLEWNFDDIEGEYNTLPGFTAGHVYEDEDLYQVSLKVAYPDDPSTSDVESTTRTIKAWVQVTEDQGPTGGTLNASSPANNPAIPDVQYRSIYISRDGNPQADGTTKANRVPIETGMSIFNGIASKENVKVYFRRDQDKAHFQPTPGSTFNLSGFSNVQFLQYRQNSTESPARPRARLALHRSIGTTQSIFTFNTATKYVSVSGLEIYIDGADRALTGRVADILGRNVAFRDLKLTKIHYGFEIGKGFAQNLPSSSYLQAEGVLLQNINRQKMQNVTSGSLVDVAYNDPSIVTGRYLVFANPPTRGLVLLGNKSGETTESVTLPNNTVQAKDHVTRSYASDVLLYGNTFTNRARVQGNVAAPQNKDIYTMRAQKGKYIYWAQNTTYGGSMLLGRVSGDPTDRSVAMQYVVIESNRIVQDPRDRLPNEIDRDSHLARLSFSSENSGVSGGRLVSDVMVRNNYFENSRRTGEIVGSGSNTRTERPPIIEGPQQRISFVHNTVRHSLSEIVPANPSETNPVTRNAPWLRIAQPLGGGTAALVMRGNLFISQTFETSNHSPIPGSDQTLIRINGFTAQNVKDGTSPFIAGQVSKNVFPTPPASRLYRFAFSDGDRTFSETSTLGWGNIFAGDSQVTVSLNSAFRPSSPTAPVATIDQATNLTSLYGLVGDLYGDLRPTTNEWTVGAVQRPA
ncbi:MAG TPA: fibronectin type III domain-containing protein, partial [Tepidisphaeraceae bacterium]|nr:fibronectin type III domain-containing protein [Tepidisphaeraceae bacterium]